MAWLSSNALSPSSAATHTLLNNLADDIRAWGGAVNGGGQILSNVEIRLLRAGVNEANPLAKLHVTAPDTGASATVILDGARTSNRNTLLFRNSYWLTGSDEYGMAHIRATDGGAGKGFLDFSTASGAGGTMGIPARRLRILDNGSVLISAAATSALTQLHVHGVGETAYAPTNGGAKGGMLYVQSLDAAALGGGAVLFGATQGWFAAIKGALTNGSGFSIGDLCISTRRATGDSGLTPAVYITSAGRLGVGKIPKSILSTSGLPIHANQAAAVTAGLEAGDMYKHSDGAVFEVT